MTAACTLSAVIHEGFTATLPNGQTGHLAVIDAKGNVIAAGKDIENAAWEVAIETYRNFLQGQGHLRTLRAPEPANG